MSGIEICCRVIAGLSGSLIAAFFIGGVIVGPDEFDLWVGEKILTAWRRLRRWLHRCGV